MHPSSWKLEMEKFDLGLGIKLARGMKKEEKYLTSEHASLAKFVAGKKCQDVTFADSSHAWWTGPDSSF